MGLLLASTGLGTVAGSLAVARPSSGRTSSRTQILSAAGFAACILVFSVMTIPIVAMVTLFVAGWMSAAFLAMNQTELQLSVEDDVRGRVLSIYLLTWGMLPVGQLAVGALSDVIGTPLAMAISCAMALACQGGAGVHDFPRQRLRLC